MCLKNFFYFTFTHDSVGIFGPLREPPGGPEGVRSTERSEPRKVATPKGARPNIMDNFIIDNG